VGGGASCFGFIFQPGQTGFIEAPHPTYAGLATPKARFETSLGSRQVRFVQHGRDHLRSLDDPMGLFPRSGKTPNFGFLFGC
jgi:hypothetical protein